MKRKRRKRSRTRKIHVPMDFETGGTTVVTIEMAAEALRSTGISEDTVNMLIEAIHGKPDERKSMKGNVKDFFDIVKMREGHV